MLPTMERLVVHIPPSPPTSVIYSTPSSREINVYEASSPICFDLSLLSGLVDFAIPDGLLEPFREGFDVIFFAVESHG